MLPMTHPLSSMRLSRPRINSSMETTLLRQRTLAKALAQRPSPHLEEFLKGHLFGIIVALQILKCSARLSYDPSQLQPDHHPLKKNRNTPMSEQEKLSMVG